MAFFKSRKIQLKNKQYIGGINKKMNDKFKYNQRLRVTYKDLKGFVESKGYFLYRQKNSTHIIFKNDDNGKTIPIPYKHGTICQGTVSKILKQMGEDRSELAKYLYE